MAKVAELKRGEVYQTYGGDLAVILDTFRSAQTGNWIVKVQFTRNIGGCGRSFDMLEVTDATPNGIPDWTLAMPDDLERRITARLVWVEKEAAGLVELVNECKA